jgi:dipeptidyl aminopeptidase/acylaminoacyl peptidase
VYARLSVACRLAAASAALLLALPIAGVLAQGSVPGPSFEQVISLRGAGGVAISPDGRSVVFGVRTADWQGNRFDNELWIARDGEQPFQLTRTDKGNSGTARWSPDGRWIAFLADRGSKQQIFLIRPSGGEAQPVTDHKEGISNFRWAPDGKRIAFTAMEPEDKERKERTERFGDYAVEDAEYRMMYLWVVDVAPDLWPSPSEAPCPRPSGGASDTTKSRDTTTARGDNARADAGAPGARCAELPKPRRLTEGSAYTVTGFDWSPDGASIAFGHQRDPLIISGPTADISVVTVATKQVRPLVTTPGGDFFAVWSPDSRWIVYSSAAGDTLSNFYANTQLFRIARDGGQPTRLAADVDENVGSLTWTRTGSLYGLTWQGAASRRLVAIDPMSGRSRILPGGPDIIFSADFAADGRTVAINGATSTTLAEVYRTTVDGNAVIRGTPITNMTGQVRDWRLGTAEVVKWKSQDGTLIEGVLHKPAGFDASRKYPLFVIIHGGPTGIDTPTPFTGYVYPVMQWLAKGALVLRPNYRGSAGYGAKFRALNVRNLGVGDAWDVLSGVDHLVQQGIVDTTRMGAMGWSQGGYISAFLTTTTNRFKAISVGAGISNWMTYYVNTDIHPFTRQYLKATPWDDPEIYAKTSPMTYIKQAKTPTLIQHGEFDRRVPIPNAYELFQGLQDRGVPVRLIVYKGFGHGIDKPKERLAATLHNWQWFGKYVWGEEVKLAGDVR